MFGYTGVTLDFLVATLAWDLNLGDLKRIIMNSIEDAAMTDTEKAELMALWENEWNKFIYEVIASVSID